MFEVRPVPRSEIDHWPVTEAGLPTRVINSVQSAGVRNIGELRTWSDSDLLNLRSLGKVSLDQIHYFFKLCSRIEKGNQRFHAISEVLDIFLDSNQQRVISQRYGFTEPNLVASRNWVTLQEIGNQDGKTRERIRQIEDTGKQKLRSRMASVCLQPFYDYLSAFVRDRSGTVSCDDLAELRYSEALGEINPCSIVLLLSDLNPERIRFHNNFFTTLPAETVEQIETHVLTILTGSAQPVHLDTITSHLIDLIPSPNEAAFRRAISVVMDHYPDVGATIDQRYFLYTTSVMPFLHEIMQKLDTPAHYRSVTNSFNQSVKARSRKGAGYILEMLNRSPQCTRVDRGLYVRTESE